MIYFQVNVGDGVKENKFIRALATAIFEDSISPNFKLQKQTLTNHSNLLLKYIDNNSNYELEGLYALQALIHKLEHPQGMLYLIKLYGLYFFYNNPSRLSQIA